VYAQVFMQKTGLIYPFVECRLPVEMLSSPLAFPYFVRTISALDYYANHFIRTMYRYNYKKINYVMSYYLGKQAPEAMEKALIAARIEIYTPVELRFKDSYKGEKDYNEAVCQSIYDSGVRPTVIYISQIEARELLLKCYDMGLRKEDIIVFAIAMDLNSLAINQSPTDKQKLYSFMPSFLGFYPACLVESEEVDYKAKFEKVFDYTFFNDCSSYDLGLTSVNAFDYALKRGLNIYNPTEMMTALRNVRFRGCTGDVQLGFNDNNRKDSMMSAYQIFNEEDKYKLYRMFDVSIISSPSFHELMPIVWYDGSNNVPKGNRYTFEDCPFPEEWRIITPYSQARTACIMLGLALLTGLLAFIFKYRVYRYAELIDIKKPIMLSTQDLLIFIASLFEPLQFLVIAPNQDFLNAISHNFFSKAIWSSIDFNNGKFWLLINSLFAMYISWLALLALVMRAIYTQKGVDLQFLLFLLLRPLNFAFLFGLLTTFDCNEGSSEFEDSSDTAFMDVDCYEDCWKGMHLNYVIGASVTLVSYLVLSILCINRLHLTLEGHQFVTSPTFLLARTVIQVSTICLYKSRPVLGKEVYSAFFLSLVGCYSGCVCLKKSINVPSLDLWHKAVTLAVLYLLMICVLEDFFLKNVLSGVGLCVSGLFVITLVTRFKLNRCARLVMQPRKADFEKWLQFAFTRSSAIHTRLESTTLMIT